MKSLSIGTNVLFNKIPPSNDTKIPLPNNCLLDFHRIGLVIELKLWYGDNYFNTEGYSGHQ